MKMTCCKLNLTVVITLCAFIMLGFSNEWMESQHSLSITDGDLYSRVDSLINTGDYFTARQLYTDRHDELSETHKLKSGLFLDYYFNQPDSSLSKMNTLFNKFKAELSDSLKYEILSVGHINYSRQYEYKKAKETIEIVLFDYSQYISESKKEDLQNTLKIWTALQDQPKQEVIINNPSELEIIRDKAGLQNLHVTYDDNRHAFVFDTGANISVITESMAEVFELNVIESTIQVGSITGQIVEARIAVAPQFLLDDIMVKNAVFLVFPNEALAFPQIDYQINGILGFPIIEAMNEIRITRDGRFIITGGQPTSEFKNMALDFFTPLLFLEDERGKGTYLYDTGASNSTLYDTYFNRYQSELADLQEVDYSFGGAGGEATKKGVYITFKPEFNNTTIPLDSTIVLKEPLNEDNIYQGTIGQDFTSQFESVTINFDQMFIRFD